MSGIPIALQLYSVRGECERDLPRAIEQVSRIGYVGAEPWGFAGNALQWLGWQAAEIRSMYDDNGLTCCGIHLAPQALDGDNLKRTIEFNRILGNNFLIVAADSGRMSTTAGIMELAETLNRTAGALETVGMFTGYHAHGFDFAEVDGKIAWDVLFASTQDEVIMQMDIGNCASGGGDPIATLARYPGRARSVHLKDFGGPEGSVIGEGQADWPAVFELCETVGGTEWYVVEEGGPEGMGFDVPERSLAALKGMGK